MGITVSTGGTGTEFMRGVFQQPDCANCILRDEVKVPPEGNPRAEVMLIGEAPGLEETVVQKPFVGRSGEALNLLLARLGVPRETLWISNTILCRPRSATTMRVQPCPDCTPTKKRKKTGTSVDLSDCLRCQNKRTVEHIAYLNDKQVLSEAVTHCKARLLAEINCIKPRVVVPLGRYALEACIGKSLGIMAHRGAVHIMQLNSGATP